MTTTRRSFLIASGLTALASTRVFGANDRLRLGVIGAGERMKGRVDVIGAGFRRRDPNAAFPQTAQQPRHDQGLAAARSRRGENQPGAGHALSPANQPSAADRRTISPITMIVGASIRAIFASEAA